MGDVQVAAMDQGVGLPGGFGQIPANFTSQDPGRFRFIILGCTVQYIHRKTTIINELKEYNIRNKV